MNAPRLRRGAFLFQRRSSRDRHKFISFFPVALYFLIFICDPRDEIPAQRPDKRFGFASQAGLL
ncbi:MAG TPA: hypothetical protein VKA68_11760 [bacterium]|nr:hypothetical protein [bacterium]